jgi:hypothetical protein
MLAARSNRASSAEARRCASALLEVLKPSDQLKVLATGEVVVDRGALSDKPNYMAERDVILDDGTTGIRNEQRREYTNKGGLARPIRAE